MLRRFRIVGSEEARLRAGLRPPPKLQVRISRMQLSRRLSDARMREKVLNRATGQARTRRTTWSRARTRSASASPRPHGRDVLRLEGGRSILKQLLLPR